ncbi:MAG TPA: antitoxin [Chloroflexota bacterium]|nr:antitoxin [Chloroflexota bacterium]
MTRTALDLDAPVLAELRSRAALEHKSMGRLASELLAQQLMNGTSATEVPPFRWVARHLGVPLVDLQDKDAVYEILDGTP